MPMLMRAIIFMSLALICYSWAVFSGRRQGLHTKHLIVFGIGLAADFLGTREMSIYSAMFGKAPEWHHITGVSSLAGMGLHFLLALAATLMGKAETVNRIFHRVSLTIYTCWVIAFASGAISGMFRLHR